MNTGNVLVNIENHIATITLNRPNKRNAFDNIMINNLKNHVEFIDNNKEIYVVIINANGPDFCAGADLAWMQKMVDYTEAENIEDAMQLGRLMQTLANLSKPSIAQVQGHVFGGGIGLVACCDIVIAADNAKFCFSEVKLGLAPATIAPYVIRKIGPQYAKRYFLTAESFNAQQAKSLQLVHEVVKSDELRQSCLDIAGKISKNASNALFASKRLINSLTPISDRTIKEMANLIAKLRTSKEAQTRLKKFLGSPHN